MSSLTYTLSIVALLLIALFAANAVAYRIRFGTFLRRERRLTSRQVLPKTEVAVGLAMVFGLLVGVAAPTIVPESSFVRWLLEPYSQIVYFAWCLIAANLVNVAVALWLRFKKAT